jgi:ribose transport system substrate-binding protein
MKPHRATGTLLAVLLAVALHASCQKSIHDKGERYVFVAANISLPYWQEAQAGFTDAAEVLGVKAEFTGPTTYSPEEELKAFQEVVASRPAGILVSPARAELFKEAIDSAVQAGIPVVCVDSDSPQSRRILFVGTDNFRAGMESGSRLANVLHGHGLVVLITIPGQHNLEERLRGVEEALAKYPDIKITKTLDDKGDPKQAADQVAGLVEGKEKFDGILCLEASGGPGAAEGLGRYGMAGKLPIVAMDKNPDTLDLIKRGAISTTIAQKPYTMSYYGLRFLDDLHHNVVHEFKDWRTAPTTTLPNFVDTGIAVVDDRNVEDFVTALVTQRKRM